MILSREEQIELVARNIGEWPGSFEEYIGLRGRVFFSGKGVVGLFARSEIESKIREITGEPDDRCAPEWANWKAQDDDGRWFRFASKPEMARKGCFDCGGRYQLAGEGEVIGDWRDTLKKVNRDKKEAVEVEKADLENGDKVLVVMDDMPWAADYIGPLNTKDKEHACYVHMIGLRVFFEEDISQAPSERDEFAVNFSKLIIDSFHNSGSSVPANCMPDVDAEYYGKIVFDAISKGKLKAPEVKND